MECHLYIVAEPGPRQIPIGVVLHPTDVIDVFLGRDEVGLARLRIKHLGESVSKHYIGESRTTHSGFNKPLFFRESRETLGKIGDVEILEIPDPSWQVGNSHESRWVYERFSRDWLVEQVAKRHPGALILLTDLDEFPSVDQIRIGQDQSVSRPVLSIPMKLSYRKVNLVLPEIRRWNKGKFVRASSVRPGIRLSRAPNVPGEIGCHFSYFGFTSSDLASKLRSFAHGEFDLELIHSRRFFSLAEAAQLDHLARAVSPGLGLLRWEPPGELSSVQRRVWEAKPTVFQESPTEIPLNIRLLVAANLARSVGRARRGNLRLAERLVEKSEQLVLDWKAK